MLKNKVAIFVPSTVQGNKPAPKELRNNILKTVKSRLATMFGGFTTQEVTGGWMSDTLGLIEESITIVYSFATDDALSNHLPTVKCLAKKLGQQMGQEAVAVEVNGVVEFI